MSSTIELMTILYQGRAREGDWLTGSIRKGKKTRGMMVEVFHKGKMSSGHCFWLLFCP